jgi:hypothetical protein
LPPGAYRFRGVAQGAAGAAGQEAQGLFWIEAMGPEYLRLAAADQVMEQLAAETGGRSVTAEGIDEVLEELPSGYRRAHVVKQAEMWNHWAVYAFLTGILALEWIWRRRRGMA